MSEIAISMCASAIRVKDWIRFLESLKGNKIPYEVIFSGPNKPDFHTSKYPEFKYIYSNVKPAQAYQIAMNNASGEIVGWTADDASYNNNNLANLDILYAFYKKLNDPKIVIAQRPIEDGRDIWYRHHFFGDWSKTPIMAPLGFISREMFNKIGGYDRNFISAQAENDIVMRMFELGGRVEICMDSYVYIDHRGSHEQDTNASMVRKYYVADRQVLENLWVIGGYGAYGQGGSALRKDIQISKIRLKPVESFENKSDICTITQGPKGDANPPWN